MIKLFHLLVLLLLFFATGCAILSGPFRPAGDEALSEDGETVEFPIVAGPEGNSNKTVRLRSGLVVSVKVVVAGRDEILEPAKRVSDDGLIVLPLVGAVDTLGLTPGGLAERLEAAYRKYFVQPQVLVDVARDERIDAMSPWGSVTVLGKVRAPGRVSIPPTRDLRVSGAIQRAGGFDASARKNAVRVTRRTESGQVMVRQVNLEAVGARGELEQDLLLEPEDVVFVSERIF
jgi:protein involved in polysaccharide export with SLBB domain